MSFDICIFSNREKAVIVWFLIFLFFGIFQKNIRSSLLGVLKVIFHKKILSVIVAMILYVVTIIIMFNKVHIWDNSLMKDTIYWIFGSAFVLVMNVNNASKNDYYFRKILIDNLKLVVLLEFIVNFYSFSFWIELVFVPVLFMVATLSAVAETKKEFAYVKKMMNYVLSLFGMALIVFAVFNIFEDYQSFANVNNVRAVILPPLLTGAYMPFLYLFALMMSYETIFVRLDIFLSDHKALARLIKIETIKACNINLKRLNRFSKNMIPDVRNLTDVRAIRTYFRNFKRKQAGTV